MGPHPVPPSRRRLFEIVEEGQYQAQHRLIQPERLSDTINH
jgi:hypothetical protein